MAGGLAIEHACGGELGRRLKQATDDQGLRQITPALGGAARQQVFEFDAPCGGQSGQDMAMWQSPLDLDGLSRREQLIAA
jgi:hypothetical protein